jgi:Ser/Thr protein kinase RdoA (MazF antagonist)
VYDIGGGRVLRRYRDGRPEHAVAREAEIMAHARAHGVPVPEVFGVAGADIVMARAAGPTMLDDLARRPWAFRDRARLLAGLHVRVHAVPALDWQSAPFGDGAALLHRDLHPQNVILTPDGPQIIDWEGSVRGPAAADVAMTWVIVAFSEVPGPRLQAVLARVLQGAFARAFLHAAAASEPAEPRWLAAAVRHRLMDHNLLPSEKARLERLARTRRLAG